MFTRMQEFLVEVGLPIILGGFIAWLLDAPGYMVPLYIWMIYIMGQRRYSVYINSNKELKE